MEYLRPPQPVKPLVTSTWKDTAAGMGMGFAMGFFIGTSGVVLHCAVNRVPLAAVKKTVLSAGTGMGSIFALGSLVRM